MAVGMTAVVGFCSGTSGCDDAQAETDSARVVMQDGLVSTVILRIFGNF